MRTQSRNGQGTGTMELICPSCEARYQLPEGAITARGRQVSCMNCGHSWHARPPMTLADPIAGGGATAPSDPRGIQYVPPTGAPSPGQTRVEEVPYSELGGGMGPVPTPQAPAQPIAQAPAPPPPPPGPAEAAGQAHGDPSRSEQMAEIRQMLAEVQSADRPGAEPQAAPEQAPVTATGPAAAAVTSAAADEAERARARLQEEREQAERAARRTEQAEAEARDSERDFRRRIEQKQDRKKAKPTDVRRLQRKHDRKVKRKKREAKAGSGAFLTGFLLIAIISASMVAMYRLEPQIVARMPSAEQPMREYVATMDRLREGAKETVGNVQSWIQEKLGDRES